MTISSATLLALLLGSVRAAAWLMICPPFNTRMIPRTVKALLSVGIALPAVPQLAPHVPPADMPSLLVASVEQVVVGMALGFLTSLAFAAIQAAGDLIDFFGGFSVATAFDPMSAAPASVFGRLYHLVAVTLLMVTGGYQLILRGFYESYRLLPLDGTLAPKTLIELVTKGMGDFFLAALQIAGPIIAVLFLTDIALGLLSRAAPALNVFSLGFPVKVLLSVGLVGLGIGTLSAVTDGVVDRALHLMAAAVTG